jgi:hypothetical protein
VRAINECSTSDSGEFYRVCSPSPADVKAAIAAQLLATRALTADLVARHLSHLLCLLPFLSLRDMRPGRRKHRASLVVRILLRRFVSTTGYSFLCRSNLSFIERPLSLVTVSHNTQSFRSNPSFIDKPPQLCDEMRDGSLFHFILYSVDIDIGRLMVL